MFSGEKIFDIRKQFFFKLFKFFIPKFINFFYEANKSLKKFPLHKNIPIIRGRGGLKIPLAIHIKKIKKMFVDISEDFMKYTVTLKKRH